MHFLSCKEETLISDHNIKLGFTITLLTFWFPSNPSKASHQRCSNTAVHPCWACLLQGANTVWTVDCSSAAAQWRTPAREVCVWRQKLRWTCSVIHLVFHQQVALMEQSRVQLGNYSLFDPDFLLSLARPKKGFHFAACELVPWKNSLLGTCFSHFHYFNVVT